MDFGVHLPLLELRDDRVPAQKRLPDAIDTAERLGYAAVSANDHLVFSRPWLDGLTALAVAAARTERLELATTIALPVVRGPAALAKALTALDLVSGGRLVAGVGPGSSPRDYEVAGIPFEERWPRFDESVRVLRCLLDGTDPPNDVRFYPKPDAPLQPLAGRPIPLWIGSWGSEAGMRRVARLADGWLASAYNGDPEDFAAARARLENALEHAGRESEGFPNAVATMWMHVTEDEAERERVLTEVLAPMVNRDPDLLRPRVCVGSAAHCAELLSRYAEAGCRRVFLWPLHDEVRQLENFCDRVRPAVREAPDLQEVRQ